MKAKKMFAKLGYKQIKNDDQMIAYELGCVRIIFDFMQKMYWCCSNGRSLCVDINVHKAIHQQLIELGWIE